MKYSPIQLLRLLSRVFVIITGASNFLNSRTVDGRKQFTDTYAEAQETGFEETLRKNIRRTVQCIDRISCLFLDSLIILMEFQASWNGTLV